MLNTSYTYKFIENNIYEISTIFNNEPIFFNAIVAKDESELDSLVEAHLNCLRNPINTQKVKEESTVTIESLQTQLLDLQSKFATLTAA
jgi:hypothetical protein